MRALSALALALFALPGVAFAQAPKDFQEEKLACLETELQEVGFTTAEVNDLLEGRIENPEALAKSRIGEEKIREIGRACFPEEFESSPSGATPTGNQPTLTPEQRACVTQFIDAELLDQILRGEVRPEDILSQERIEDIGRTCFADHAPPEHIPPTLDLPSDVATCLKAAVGEQAFNEISSGRRPPTPQEMTHGQPCFPSGSEGQGLGGVPEGIPDLPPGVAQCIIEVIGQTKFDQAKNSSRPEAILTSDEMRRIGETCFGSSPPSGAGHPTGGPGGGPPPEIIACVEGILGKARVQEFLRGVPPTPAEMEQAKGCFPPGSYGAPPGPGGSPPDLPPGVRACLEGVLDPSRVAELLTGRSQPTAEEIQTAQSCFGSGGPGGGPTGPPAEVECVPQCAQAVRPDGSRYTEDECRQLCSRPGPVSSPGPGGEPVEPPGGAPTPVPTVEPVPTYSPEPTPVPTPDQAQCVASCTGYQKSDGTTYSAEECSLLCGGTVQGAATERAAPWWLTFLLNVTGL